MTRTEAARDGVTVPTNLKDYCIATKPPQPQENVPDLDFYDDDYMEDDDEDDDDGNEALYGDEEDSGNSDS